MYEIKLLSIRGEAQEGNTTMLNLTFNGNVNKIEFERFFVFNNSNFIDLTFTEIHQYNNRSSIEVKLDFKMYLRAIIIWASFTKDMNGAFTIHIFMLEKKVIIPT